MVAPAEGSRGGKATTGTDASQDHTLWVERLWAHTRREPPEHRDGVGEGRRVGVLRSQAVVDRHDCTASVIGELADEVEVRIRGARHHAPTVQKDNGGHRAG